MSTWNLGTCPYLEMGFLQKSLVKMRSFWVGVRPKSNDWGLYKTRSGRADREEELVMTESAMQVQAEKCRGARPHQELGGRPETTGPPSEPPEGANPADILVPNF